MKKHLETKTRLEIKKLYEETDYTLNDLAELYGVCQRTIFRIVHGELYLKKVNKRFTDEELKQHERERQKRYREENKEKIREKDRIRRLNRRHNDPNYRLKCYLRSRLWHAINEQKAKKTNDTHTLVGCSIEELKQHLEKQFKEGMTWDNYGEWHIDHIIPCSKFDLTKKEEQLKCFNYTNLQPLWAEENIKKGDKILN